MQLLIVFLPPCLYPLQKRCFTEQRLINWGYAVCDAALRAHVDPRLPPAGGISVSGRAGVRLDLFDATRRTGRWADQ
jgi:hypothetical protein